MRIFTTRLGMLLFLTCNLTVVPAIADHDTAARILGKWAYLQSKLYILKPAATVRTLPPNTNPELKEGIASAARTPLGNSMGAVILDQGTLVYEGYDNGAATESKMEAYSMTKALTGLAVGEALCAGKISSLDDRAVKYVPQLEGTAYGAASLRQLLSYTSGAQDPGGNGYVGIHNPGDFRLVLQHSISLLDLARKYGEARFEPGKKFIYNGLDSDTLSLVIRSATGSPLPQWFESTVWQKAGGEFTAGWYVDRDGNGVAEVGFYASTRDYARIGQYIADRLTGKSGDTCMNEYMKEAAKPHVNKGYWASAPRYGLSLHVGADGNTWMMGHGGQRVGINVRNGRVVAFNGFADWRGVDDAVQGLLNR